MNKEKLIKWSKRISIVLGSIVGVYLLIVLIYFTYTELNENYFIPMKCESLYKQGLRDTDKSDSIALVLEDLWDREKAIALLKNTALKGQVSSQVLLGDMYKDSDKDKAAYWYLEAAKNGNAKAQGETGYNYFWGNGIKKDFSKAVYWVKKGAKGGDANAQYLLGLLYSRGVALYDLDYFHTRYIYLGDNTFRRESLDDDIMGIKITGKRFEDIIANPYNVYLVKDLHKAKYYWELSAKQGFQEAQDALEKVYE